MQNTQSQQTNDSDMFDDFGDDETNNNNSNKEFLIEQRTTERLLNEINTSGFRDGHQKFMEDEKYLQTGFDSAYRNLARLAFLAGRIRSLCIHSLYFKNDSAFLSKLTHKLEKIEKYNYECLIKWNGVEARLDLIEKLVNYFESKLNSLKQLIVSLSLNEANSSAKDDLKGSIDSVLDSIEFYETSAQTSDEQSEIVDENLYNFITNLKI